jgi:hypothetical protein
MMARLLLVFVAGLAGCGARSTLGDPPARATAGGGGSGSVGTSGTTGAGGVGAGAGGTTGTGGGACTELVWASPIVEVEEDGAHLARRPRLAPSSDDGQQITVALQRSPLESPGPFAEMRHATFHPWLDWPASGVLGPTFATYASPQLDPEFAVTGAPGGMFGMLVGHGGLSASFSPRVDPFADSGTPTVGVAGTTPLFAARNGDAQVVGVLDAKGTLLVTLVRAGMGSFDTELTAVACSPQRISAAAVLYEDGFIVVTSNGAGNAQSLCSAGPDGAGPPTRVDVVLISWGKPPAFVLGVDAGSEVEDVAAAPHPDGVWAVWRTQALTGVPPLRAARFQVASAGVVGPGDVTEPGDAPFAFAAAALGSRLAVAWKSDPANNPPDLRVRVLDASLGLVAAAALDNALGFDGSTSLVGSPAGDSLVVAWTANGMAARAKLGRLDCIGGI